VNWKLHLAWPLCLAISLADARSATVDLVETVHYSFVFENPGDRIFISFPWDPWISVTQEAGSGEYSPIFGFEFFHYGSQPLGLQGTTISLGGWHGVYSLPAPIEQGWQSFGADDSYWSLLGTVTLGADNIITGWNVSTFGPHDAEDRWFASDPEYVDAGFDNFWYLDDASPYVGQAVYGINDSDHYGSTYWTSPGRWTTSIQKRCYAGEYGDQIACPDAVSLSTQIAVAPVPPSLILLASGIAGIGLLRRRRSRLAG
jgi:hypothetical protein